MNEREVDKVLELVRATISDEIYKMIPETAPSDYTTQELIALAAVVRPVYERQKEQERPPAPVLKLELVRPESAKEPHASHP
ncbi:hypothetical protein [Mycolicibacterium sp. D5.8-2]|uniref:hypothetical protein n=1 Tax=Mycolicibacterium sp. D5.8-2 TaxID=3085903 RepID=UPI00298CD847|nr:hypothetical protein [Mycolicibacterium sp. D5.8-2]MDW5614602.1 hypothetical protein [Mycolicibacterium sp. D5.8-2]